MTDEKTLASDVELPGMESQLADGGVLGAIGRKAASRRQFIKGVIASGAVVSSAGYVFGGLGGCSTDQPGGGVAAGGVERLISLNINGETRRVDALPFETF